MTDGNARQTTASVGRRPVGIGEGGSVSAAAGEDASASMGEEARGRERVEREKEREGGDRRQGWESGCFSSFLVAKGTKTF
jgi:hypothetical protein